MDTVPSRQLTLRRRLVLSIVLAIILVGVVFYYFFDPLQTKLMPQCLFHRATGLQCIGCGSQRMLHSMLHGDFIGAFHANPFAFCSLPFLAFMLWLEVYRLRHPRLYARVFSVQVIYTIGGLLAAWLILRNIFQI